MSFLSRSVVFLILSGFTFSHARVLNVCADPNNLPFSNQTGAGFENKLAELVAKDLGVDLQYTWWPQRKSFLKNSLLAGKCDVVLGIPAETESVLATQPYYRSTYVIVERHGIAPPISSLADERLARLRIGVHVVADDYAPPAHALARRGLSANLVAFSLFGPDREPDPPSKIVQAVAAGDVDVAIVWGPFAGYFARSARQPLDISPVTPAMWMGIPFTFEISMAVGQVRRPLRKNWTEY